MLADLLATNKIAVVFEHTFTQPTRDTESYDVHFAAPEILRKAGVISTKRPVKILGDGELTSALTVYAHKFSKSAQEKITKAGGKFEVL